MNSYIIITKYNGYSFISGYAETSIEAAKIAQDKLAFAMLHYHNKGAKPKILITQITNILQYET